MRTAIPQQAVRYSPEWTQYSLEERARLWTGQVCPVCREVYLEGEQVICSIRCGEIIRRGRGATS